MSCISLMKIRSVRETGIKKAYVPCGNCLECQEKAKFSWQFRLRAEWQGLTKRLEVWHCAFATLTYGTIKGGWSADKRPIIHRRFYKNPSDFNKENPIYCFNKHHVQKLINNLKVWLHDKFGITKDIRFRYLVAAEYGDWTHRPHYHILLFYPMVNGLTDEMVYNYIKTYWENRYGMMFPQKLNGGDRNRKGKIEKPFVVENKDGRVEDCIAYVSKYVCKDLEFSKVVAQNNIQFHKNKLFKYYDSFHIQSKSLGACLLDNMTYTELHDIYFNGYAFKGDEKKRPLPVYLNHKIIFDNYYVYEKDEITGEMKRLVRKKANDFFKKYYTEIFNLKVDFYKESFKKLMDVSFYTEYNVDVELSKKFAGIAVDIIGDVGDPKLAEWSVSQFGRLRDKRYIGTPSLVYLSRYDLVADVTLWYRNRYEDVGYVKFMDDNVNTLLSILHILGIKNSSIRQNEIERFLHLYNEDLTEFT